MYLSNLKIGESGTISNILATGAIAQKLIDMGFVIGEEVRVIRHAPLKDPIEVEIASYQVSIRRDEASLISLKSNE